MYRWEELRMQEQSLNLTAWALVSQELLLTWMELSGMKLKEVKLIKQHDLVFSVKLHLGLIP